MPCGVKSCGDTKAAPKKDTKKATTKKATKTKKQVQRTDPPYLVLTFKWKILKNTVVLSIFYKLGNSMQ